MKKPKLSAWKQGEEEKQAEYQTCEKLVKVS